MIQTHVHSEEFQKFMGFISAIVHVGIAIAEYVEPGGPGIGPIHLILAAFFLASARYAILGAFQGALLFASAALQNACGQSCFYGLGFAIMAVVALFRQGWFFRDSGRKALIAAGIGSLILVTPILFSSMPWMAKLPVLTCAAAYSILVYGLAKRRFLAALAPKKKLLRLSDYKLTKQERRVVTGWLLGMTAKELAVEHKITVNTVNNTICHSYHKLGLDSREELMALGERYRIE